MTASAEREAARARPVPDDLPPALSSMWRLCKLGYRHEPGLLVASFLLSLAAALPDALLALWLALLGKGVLEGDRRLLLVAAAGLGLSAAATWVLRTVDARVQRRFRDRVTIALEAHVARLQASVATIAHQERPEWLDRLTVLREQVFVLDHLYMSLFSTAGWVLRLGVTVGLLVSISPWLAALALFALPTILTSAWRPAVERARPRSAAPSPAGWPATCTRPPPPPRRARRCGSPASATAWPPTAAPPGSGGTGRWPAPAGARRPGTRLAWAVFGAGYVGRGRGGGLGAGRRAGGGAAGAGRRVAAVGLHRGHRLRDRLPARDLDGRVPPAGLAGGLRRGAGGRRPTSRCRRPSPTGIRLEHVSFAYPGTDRLVLDDVSLELPAGAVVAVVGENGAGKTTLVKLLCKLYEPTSGRILVDGRPLDRMDAAQWRSRLAGAFQDFFRFELRARHSVGVGDLPRLDDEPAVAAAVGRAGAADVVGDLAAGLDTQLGPTWPGGVEVSFGQWQKLALARGFMREGPLLLVLDEPTAALDAETEHALFERYAAAAGAGGGITMLVSHRFSTVRMADLIVVLDGARLVEVGSHAELLARGGQYAELYGIQAAAYRDPRPGPAPAGPTG